PMPGPKRHRHWLIAIVTTAAVLAIAVVVVIVGSGSLASITDDKLDITAAESGVLSVLTEPTTGYGLHDVQDVRCNHGVNPPIVKGATFVCEFTIHGRPSQATMTFLDDTGAYAVGRPQ
ncbi:DUF4333 domain-containing protein, partial [Mycobacterium sp. E1319]|uniref:DUF4333 domain-containing protein n=2 Tax=unclassified Mycobacterium TaxID=2642494 RepID=UPI000ACFFA58